MAQTVAGAPLSLLSTTRTRNSCGIFNLGLKLKLNSGTVSASSGSFCSLKSIAQFKELKSSGSGLQALTSHDEVTADQQSVNANLVVLTRELGKNEKLRKALSGHNVDTVELPLIQHEAGPDRNKLKEIIASETFDWIVITSPEAGAVFLEGWIEAGSPKIQVATVGGGTTEVFSKLAKEGKISVGFTPSKANAKFFSAELPMFEGGTNKVLYPASVKASQELQNGLEARGFSVTRLNTYSTSSVTEVDDNLLRVALQAPVVTFGSPTAVKAWMKLVQKSEVPWQGMAACIGSTSAEASRKEGLVNIFYPESPGLEGWVQSVLEALEASKKTNVEG